MTSRIKLQWEWFWNLPRWTHILINRLTGKRLVRWQDDDDSTVWGFWWEEDEEWEQRTQSTAEK